MIPLNDFDYQLDRQRREKLLDEAARSRYAPTSTLFSRLSAALWKWLRQHPQTQPVQVIPRKLRTQEIKV